jgi:signal transduction histidine kinase
MITTSLFLLNFSLGQVVQFLLLGLVVIATLACLFILDKIDLNKFFIFINYRLALKIAIYITSLITLLFIIFFTIHSPNLTQVYIPLIVLVILVIIGLVYALKAAHQYEIVAPEKYHDLKKILTLLNLNAEDAQTVDELKEMIDTTIKLMGIQIAKNESQKSEDEPEDFEAFIRTAIQSIKLNYQSSVEINTNIQFFEPHKNVNAMNISYMLGILLENAIETGPKHPILVDILSTEHILMIKVANEAELKRSQELENMFSKGYSSKGKIGRGFGLPNLAKFVDSYQGQITITQEMNVEFQTNYIVFMLNF